MLQSNNIPQEANVLLLPVHFYLTDAMSDLQTGLAVKEMLNDVFLSYLLRVDHGFEFSRDNKYLLYCLNQSLQELLDMIAIQNTSAQ